MAGVDRFVRTTNTARKRTGINGLDKFLEDTRRATAARQRMDAEAEYRRLTSRVEMDALEEYVLATNGGVAPVLDASMTGGLYNKGITTPKTTLETPLTRYQAQLDRQAGGMLTMTNNAAPVKGQKRNSPYTDLANTPFYSTVTMDESRQAQDRFAHFDDLYRQFMDSNGQGLPMMRDMGNGTVARMSADEQVRSILDQLDEIQRTGNTVERELARDYYALFDAQLKKPVAGTVGTFAEGVASGLASYTSNLSGGIQAAVGDAVTGGKYAEGFKKLDEYFAERPGTRQQLGYGMHGDLQTKFQYQDIHDATGVDKPIIQAYLESTYGEALQNQALQDAQNKFGLSETYANKVYSQGMMLGRQIPGWMMSSGLGPNSATAHADAYASGLQAYKDALQNMQGLGAAREAFDVAYEGFINGMGAGEGGLIGTLLSGGRISDAVKKALRGNVSTYLIGAMSAAGEYSEKIREHGYGWQNYVNAVGKGFSEYFTEGLFGFSDMPSYQAWFGNTVGTSAQKVLRAIGQFAMMGVEEGLEEVANVPLEQAIDMLTGYSTGNWDVMMQDPQRWDNGGFVGAKALFAPGGLFDVDAMWEAGIDGAIGGWLMGLGGAVVSIGQAVSPNSPDPEIKQAIDGISALADKMPERFRPQKPDANTASYSDVVAYKNLVLQAIKDYRDNYTTLPVGDQLIDVTGIDTSPAPVMPSEASAAAVTPTETSYAPAKDLVTGTMTDALKGSRAGLSADAQALAQSAWDNYVELHPNTRVTAQQFVNEFSQPYMYGRDGATMEQARASFTGELLTDATFEAAYRAGVAAGTETDSDLPEMVSESDEDYEAQVQEFADTFSNADRIMDIYRQQSGMNAETFTENFSRAYDMGRSGVSNRYLSEVNELNDAQRTAAYQMGRSDARTNADTRAAEISDRQKKGNLYRAKGTVRGIDVTIADLKQTFNDRQGVIYRLLTKYAESTGLNIVIYKSQPDENGNYTAEQGRFQWKDDTIYIDLNSGLMTVKDVKDMGQYTALRVFAHEFTHFIEKWNPQGYNEFREFVFNAMEQNGTDVNALIEKIQTRDESGKMTYEQASREAVAMGMTEVLPDSRLVQQLAEEQPNIFRRLLAKLRDFVARLKQYYKGLNPAGAVAQALMQNGKYLDGIVDMWDRIGKQAVDSYQGAVSQVLIDMPEKPENLPKYRPRRAETQTQTAQVETAEQEQAEVLPVQQQTEPVRETVSETAPAAEASAQTEETQEINSNSTVEEIVEASEESSEPLEPVPAASATEAAEERLTKGVRVPIETSNIDALRQGILSKELSTDNITLKGTVHGLNVEQRAVIIDALLKARYAGEDVANISIPYDGKMELNTDIDSMLFVLNELGAKVTQDVIFNKKLDRYLRGYKTIVFKIGDQSYIANSFMMFPITDEAAEFAKSENGYKSEERTLDNRAMVGRIAEDDGYSVLRNAPEEVQFRSKNIPSTYRFKAESGENVYFDKRNVNYFDGNILYLKSLGNSAYSLKAVNTDGDVFGYVLNARINSEDIKQILPAKLKSFSSKVLNSIPTETTAEPAAETKPVPETKPEPVQEQAKPTETERKPQSRFYTLKWKNGTPSQKAAYRILMDYLRQDKALTSTALYEICDEAFGGTQGEGAYNRKDAYDAMELAVNQLITEKMRGYNTADVEIAQRGVEFAQRLLANLPTQNVRTQEQLDFQQFSTPPSIAYLAAWAANINAQDHVLEPSAGIGGLAAFAKAWGAETTVNELSPRRFGIIQALGFDHYFNENAEHINNILPDNIQPTVVIMNPPFSATAGRTRSNKTSNAELHINSALDRLAENGRLVAILGRGMADDKYARYWNELRKDYTIRANIGIDGKNYTKYGTSFDVQIVVIDKTGPQGNTKTITGNYEDLSQVPGVLEAIRNDRSTAVERNPVVTGNQETAPVERKPESTVHPAVDQGNTEDRGSDESGSRNGTGRDGRNGSADVQRPERGGETVPNSGTSERGTVQQQRNGEESEAGGETSIQSEGRRSDTGTAGTPANVPGESGSERSRPASEPSRGGQVSADPVTDDGVYTGYHAPEIPIKGAKPHPAVLVESAAMGAVDMPKATYKPHIPESVIESGALSDAQLVSVTYAGQAHEQILPNGDRRGFFIGDGTGVGKGRTISGIILDNFNQGRKKALWISENTKLMPDAIRDWTDISGRSKDDITDLSKYKVDKKIENKPEGIIFTSYSTLRSADKSKHTRLDQLVDWLGKDFDGVIAFDEAHNMGNLLGKTGPRGHTKGSGRSIAATELQKRLPNARIIYVSATAATEVGGLAFASRLGLWGPGTAFTDVNDFVNKIGASGLSAMELVIRDMKAMGMYVARSISYNGVEYDTVQHKLDPVQRQIYDTMSRAWQKTMRSVEQSLDETGAKLDPQARSNARGQYFSAIQRFYNQVLTSMSMPSVIADMKKELANGRSCVLQIVNTNQAEADRQIADIKARNGELDEMDLTPRGTLIDYLMNNYPIILYEEYMDDDGNLRSRPVLNSDGEPVIDKKAVARRDALIAEVNEMSIPDGPLEMLFDAFGTENVSEITGRARRVVPRKQTDGSIKRVEESRTPANRKAEISAFQNGDTRILVFSAAGGTGASYHADVRAKNQQQRVHYVLQPGWEASKAVQGFGRTHRSNEVSAPIYKLVTTDIKGQKRFTSTIARRLDQLGALTKGQRDTGSGMFGSSDNLETDLARDSLREFYNRLGKDKLEGINGRELLEKLGLLEKFTGEHGEFKLDETVARDISKFLNRILALEVDEQNTVFDAFINIYETELENAIKAGTLDRGMENVKADKIEILDDKVIHEQKNTGAATHYVQAKVYTKPKAITTVAAAERMRSGFIGIYRTKDGDVRAVYQLPDKTDVYGRVHKQYRLQSPNISKSSTWIDTTFDNNAEEIPKADWQKSWNEELKKLPEYNEEVKHMLTGSLLPIWSSLPTDGSTKVQRLITDDGKAYLGRIIPSDQIDSVLRNFNINRTKETYTAKSVMDKALKTGSVFNLTYQRAKLYRSRVSGEWRLEYYQPYNTFAIQQQYPDMMMERINYTNRYFIPNNAKGEALLDKILENNPVATVSERNDDITEYSMREPSLSNREVLRRAANELEAEASDENNTKVVLTDAERNALNIFQQRLDRLDAAVDQRTELGRQYRNEQFTKGGDREEAARMLNQMNVLDVKIKSLENSVLMLENKDILKTVLRKARRVIEQADKQRADETLRKWRERRNESAAKRKYRDMVRHQVERLRSWLMHPSNKNVQQHIPAELQKSVADFLESINLMSQKALNSGGLDTTKADRKYLNALRKMREAIRHNVDSRGLYSGYNDIPENFEDTFRDMIDTAQDIIDRNTGGFVVNEMSAGELQKLSMVLRSLAKWITKMNEFHNNAMFQHAYDAGQETVTNLEPFNKSTKGNRLYKFLRFDYMRPSYVFEHIGKGGVSIEHEFREGQGTAARLADQVIQFAEQTFDGEEVKDWGNQIFEVELENGDKVTLKATQLMSLYALTRREQAQTHLYGVKEDETKKKETESEGKKKETESEGKKNKKKKKINGGFRVANFKNGRDVQIDDGHTVTRTDVQRMINLLSDRQIQVVEALQDYMSTVGAKMGNYVSMKRFDTEQFTDPHYWPISVDGRYLPATADESPDLASLYALLNLSFTKELKENASNPVILYDAFDVFANHMSQMIQYRSFALPVLDALKWFNYSDENGNSVRKSLSRAFGGPMEERVGNGAKGYAESFVINLLRAYNGTSAMGDPYDTIGLGPLHRFNRAQVAYNARVAIQQPMAITRAAMYLPAGKLIKGLRMSAAERGKLAEEMEAHSGIAPWKRLGFYDTNVSRGLTDLIKRDTTFGEKVIDVGLKGAEAADRFTWAAIWYAAKETVSRSDYETEDAYFDAVKDKFEDVIYKTQVVDSVLTKSEFLRAKGFMARSLGSFMSEPMTTASMLMDAYYKYADDIQRGMSRSEAWKNNRRNIGRTTAVYAIGQILLAAVQSIVDAWRDDDDYQTWLEKYWEAFKRNAVEELLPFGNFPIVKEAWDIAKGLIDKTGFWDWLHVDLYGNNNGGEGWIKYANYLVKASEIMIDKLMKKETSYTWWGMVYNLLRGAAGATGYPIATGVREVIDAWNNVVGGMAPSLKVRSWYPGDKANIKYAHLDGYLTEEEAIQELIDKGEAEDRNDAFWEVRKWDGDDKYSDLITAVYNDNSAAVLDQMVFLADHGVDEKDAMSKVRSFVKHFYDGKFTTAEQKIVTDTTMTDEKAIRLLVDYGGWDEDTAFWKVQDWKAEASSGEAHGKYDEFFEAVETGVDLDHVIQTYLDHGVSENTLKSQITSQFKEQYVYLYETDRTAAKALKRDLVAAYVKLGDDETKAENKIDKWISDLWSMEDNQERLDQILGRGA